MAKYEETNNLIRQLKQILDDFHKTFGVTDIITNSKIFEVMIADSLGHILIPGHSGSRDAKDESGNEFEYKHYKESSSNHTWTFNDFSDTTIAKLVNTKSVIFAHIQDVGVSVPTFDWYYEVPGKEMSEYLAWATPQITNNRKMINVSSKKIEEKTGLTKQKVDKIGEGCYVLWIKRIMDIASRLESLVGTSGILTSNKFWEVLVALKLGHKVQSEQANHDATDNEGNTYEYKVAKSPTWSFQDISREVLQKYLQDKTIVLAVVNKDEFLVKKIYEINPKRAVQLLKQKLKQKAAHYRIIGKQMRRIQVSFTGSDLLATKAELVYSDSSQSV